MAYQSGLAAQTFNNQIILVTGGGSGIGRCIAHELASLGAHVCLLGRKIEKLQRVEAEILADGGKADHFTVDIREETRVKAVIQEVLAKHGKINALVNNAGGQFPSPAAYISTKGFEAVVRTNLVGGFIMSREVFGAYFQKNGGAIVNIVADMFGGMPGMAHSGAARAGMVNLTETLAIEWGSAGVRVNAVAPGYVASSGLDTYDDAFIKQLLPTLSKAVPLQRLSEEAEISSAVCFLLAPMAAYINGVCLRVDGGSSLNTKMFPLQPSRNEAFQGFHRAQAPKALEKNK